MLRLPVVAAVVLTALIGTGCTIPGSGPPVSNTATAAGSGAPATASGPPAASASPGSVESESANRAGIDLTALPPPIASGRLPARVSDDPDATMELTLYSLRRTGKVLTATFSFRVQSSGAGGTGTPILGYLGTAWRPFLVDTANLKRHDVLTSGDDSAMTGSGLAGQRFLPGQTLYAYAMFAAPPAGVTTMDVQLATGLPTAVGVPIT